MRWLAILLAGCGLACSTPETLPEEDGSGGGAPRAWSLAGATFGTLEVWATPIEDYVAAGNDAHGAGQFNTAIHDLTPYDERLYLSYGDADVNMGRTIPIGLRYFAGTDDAVAVNEHDTDEEHIERYRLLGDDLWAAGVDATEDAWLGNVYLRTPSEPWHKSRTLDEGVHIHDVALFDGAHWAVGSGSAPREWTGGDIFAHLWRSDDAGASFSIAERVHNGGDGDARWVRLLPHGDQLYLFGYTSNAQFQVDALIGATYGDTLTMLPEDHALSTVFVSETDVFSDGTGLVRGVDTGQEPLVQRAYHLAEHTVREVDALYGFTVIDVFEHAPTQEKLILVRDGDTYGEAPPPTGWTIRLFATVDFVELTELFSFRSPTPPTSIAYWREHLFMGMDDGRVYRGSAL